jgi:hypothetical protein
VSVQAVIQYEAEDVAHWQAAWVRSGTEARWCSGSVAYHELVGLYNAIGQLRLWDPTDGHPLEPGHGYGQPVALRLTGGRALRFGNHLATPGVWQSVIADSTQPG